MKKIIEIKESILNTFLEMDDNSDAFKIAYYLPCTIFTVTGTALCYSGKINVAKLLNLKGNIFNLQLPMLFNLATGVIGSLIAVACWHKVLYGRKHEIDDVNNSVKEYLGETKLWQEIWKQVVEADDLAIFTHTLRTEMRFKYNMSADEAKQYYKEIVQKSGDDAFKKNTDTAFTKGFENYVTELSKAGRMEKQAANVLHIVCDAHSIANDESFIDYFNRLCGEVRVYKFKYIKEDFNALCEADRMNMIEFSIEGRQR